MMIQERARRFAVTTRSILFLLSLSLTLWQDKKCVHGVAWYIQTDCWRYSLTFYAIRPQAASGTRVERRHGVQFHTAAAQTRVKIPAGRTWDAVRPVGFYFCLMRQWNAACGQGGLNRTLRFDWGGQKRKKLGQNISGPGFVLNLGRANVSRWTLVQRQVADFFFFFG